MKVQEIRKKFLEFFESKEHRIVPSAPIVVKDDPTLMFINAGMNPFKDYFLGTRKAEYPRVADSQKCLRVSGKHNDIEEVGVDTYHHTMFEMLGNWSFGSEDAGELAYFKEEAIGWAWELLTEVYKIDPERLYATVFEGDDSQGLPVDEESIELWSRHLPKERILKYGAKDNFWVMGATGPCGPCSEIHIDLRDDEDRKKTPGADLVNEGHNEVIEIWNLVFIQFNRKADNSLEELPGKHVDTGMGFERLCMVLQDKRSSYDTGVFKPLIEAVEKIAGVAYGKDLSTDIAIRVVVDHIRAVSFAIADGQLPSNTGAGYVIRRILRRAVRFGFTHLKQESSFLDRLFHVLADQLKEAYPELTEQGDFIAQVIGEEENSFLRTLGSGIKRFDQLIKELDGKKEKTIPGSAAFELYDTYGFPVDLTRQMAAEQGMKVDEPGFESSMKEQKDRSREKVKQEAGEWIELIKDDKQEFVGYDYTEAEVKITRYREVAVKGKTMYHLVFQLTPFYAEGGGQIGDTGSIEHDDEKIRILDTKRENQLIVHLTDKLPSDLTSAFKAKVDSRKRELTACNHSATHLLHASLKKVLGDHVQQKGSLVSNDYLRFDFSHFAKMTDEELNEVESMVNEKIRANIVLEEERDVPFKKAMDRGVTALFGEKYGDVVRIISFDPQFSSELCGGIHVKSTSQIGMFRIVSEGSVAAGIRRIEAITSDKAFVKLKEEKELLDQVRELTGKDILASIQSIQKENQQLKVQLDRYAKLELNALREKMLAEIREVNGCKLVSSKVALGSADLVKELAYSLKQKDDSLISVIGADIDGKPHLSIMLPEKMVDEKGWDAGKIIREAAKEIKGGGGGQKFYATAGGKDVSGLERAIEVAVSNFI